MKKWTALFAALVLWLAPVSAAFPQAQPVATLSIGLTGDYAQVLPVTLSSQYSSGNCLGPPTKVDLSAPSSGAAMPGNGVGSIYVTGLMVTDSSKQNAILNVYVLNAQPTGTYTDKSSCTLAAADYSKVKAIIPVTTYTADGANSVDQSYNGGINLIMNTGTTNGVPNKAFWYVVMLNGSTPTYTGNLVFDWEVTY